MSRLVVLDTELELSAVAGRVHIEWKSTMMPAPDVEPPRVSMGMTPERARGLAAQLLIVAEEAERLAAHKVWTSPHRSEAP